MTDVINEHLERTDLFVPCYGVFATEGEASVEFDRTVPDWVVVKITDEDGNHWETLTAEEDDEE